MPTAKYRFKFASLKTGAFLGEFPLAGVKFQRMIANRGAGTWSASLPLTRDTMKLDPLSATDPNVAELVIERNGVIVGGGWLNNQDYDDSTNSLMIDGREIFSYLDARYIESDLTYAATDQGLILRDLFVRAAASPDGDIRVDLPTAFAMTTGQLRDKSYASVDVKPMSEAMTELGNLIGGFEFYLQPYWTGTIGSQVLRHQLIFGFPIVGTAASGWKWSKPAGSILGYTWPRLGINQGNEIFAVGDNGQGGARVTRVKTIPGAAPLVQRATSWRGVKEVATLLAHAQADLVRYAAGAVTPRIRVKGDGSPDLVDFSLGDGVTFSVNDPRLAESDVFRIIGWQVQCPEAGKNAEIVDLYLV